MENLYFDRQKKNLEDLLNHPNINKIIYLIRFQGKEKNVEKVINLCKDVEEFEMLCDNGNVKDILRWGREKNVEKVINLCKDVEEFEILCDNENVRDVLEIGKENILEFIINKLDKKIAKNIIENVYYKLINQINIENIRTCKKGIFFGFFIKFLRCGIDLDKIDFPITKQNFTDFMEENEVFIEFEKDKGVVFEGTKPWTKKWFLEDPKRKEYLISERLRTFEKFGTLIGLGIIEGSQNIENIRKYYNYVFQNINLKKSRSAILQVGEVFSLILKWKNYDIFDELLSNSNIGKEFKKFIEDYSISDKGRTILKLLIAKEIRDSFQIWKNKKGEEQVDYLSIETLLKKVQEKIKLYNTQIKKYKELPIKTSIGMEYEVTKGIAKGYKKEIGSNYKNDIETISEYAGVSKGADAVHEIATTPTDNPILLILEMKLLEDLDFLDLNFKKEDYKKGSRGLHITLGGEYGIRLDKNTNFIQNILIASNLGGLNAGEEIKKANQYSNIKDKGDDCELLFGERKTPTVEYRSLSIDKKEQFERLIVSIFNLNMAKQLLDKEFDDKKDILEKENLISFESFMKGKDKSKLKEYKIIYEILKLKKDIYEIIKDQTKNFIKNEIIDDKEGTFIGNLVDIFTSTAPFIGIMQKIGIDIDYFKELLEYELKDNKELTKDKFIEKLRKDGKKIDILTEKQVKILYLEYKSRIRKMLGRIKKENNKIYENIGKYLNGNIKEIRRKITNKKRWEEVIGNDKNYLNSLNVDIKDFEEVVSPEFINKFTRINNLFIKKDSVNALAMYDNTKESYVEKISGKEFFETGIFDKLENGLKKRKGYYIIQGASEKMIVQAIQKRILEFNMGIDEILVADKYRY